MYVVALVSNSNNLMFFSQGLPGRAGDPGPPGGMNEALKKNMMKITEDVARQVSQSKSVKMSVVTELV